MEGVVCPLHCNTVFVLKVVKLPDKLPDGDSNEPLDWELSELKLAVLIFNTLLGLV